MKLRYYFFLFLFYSLLCCNSDAKEIQKMPVVNGVGILPHPRLLFTEKDETAIKEFYLKDPLSKGLFDLLLTRSEDILKADQLPYKKGSDGTLLMTSREYVYRFITLSLSYRLTKNRRYADKVEEMLLWVCKYPDWNPSHYLDVAEMTTGVAIAYDWTYDVLSQNTKDLVKYVIYERSLIPVTQEYIKGNKESWAKRETNWNVVCNSGMLLGALATAEDYPAMATDIVNNSVKFVPNCLKHFAPDGVCYEGPAYWGYTNIYLAMYLKALRDNFNSDYGISSLPGVDKTARFYLHTISPSGKVFNFADANSTVPDKSPAFFLFSKIYDQPDVASIYRSLLKDVVEQKNPSRWHFFLSLAWFDPSNSSITESFSSLNTFYGINDIFVFNGNDSSKAPLYLIGKGADPDRAHQQLDGGTFVVESEGIRWTEDLGVDSYSMPGFWDYAPDGKRWNYFRNTNFAHNTFSIDGKLQYSKGRAFISSEDKHSLNPSVTLDMTELYKDKVTLASRKFRMINDATIDIEDKIDLIDNESEICWSIVTGASIETKENNAILTSKGKKFYFKILLPKNGIFQTKEAKPYTQYENPIKDITILKCIVKPENKETKILIRMSSEEIM